MYTLIIKNHVTVLNKEGRNVSNFILRYKAPFNRHQWDLKQEPYYYC